MKMWCMIKFSMFIKKFSQRCFLFPIQSTAVQDKERKNISRMFSKLDEKYPETPTYGKPLTGSAQ